MSRRRSAGRASADHSMGLSASKTTRVLLTGGDITPGTTHPASVLLSGLKAYKTSTPSVYKMQNGKPMQIVDCCSTAGVKCEDMKMHARECGALIHLVHASDARLCSTLWELYLLARVCKAHVPVVVVVLCDEATPPGSMAAACALSDRGELPPRSSAEWAAERARRAEALRDFELIQSTGQTTMHRFEVQSGASTPRGEYPALAALHRGPWLVLPLDVTPERELTADAVLMAAASKPFRWLAEALTRPVESEFDVIVRRDL